MIVLFLLKDAIGLGIWINKLISMETKKILQTIGAFLLLIILILILYSIIAPGILRFIISILLAVVVGIGIRKFILDPE